MKETKATEFEQALYASIEEMKEEFKVVKSALDIEKEVNKSNNESIKKLKDQVQKLQKDLELENPRYGSDSTRKLARDAYNQSTAEANWDSLEKHPVVKNLYKAIADNRKDLGSMIYHTEQRLDRAKPANEVFAAMADHSLIKLMRAEISKNHGLIEGAIAACDKDRHHGNQQDFKLRDTLADHKTALNLLDFMLGESVEMFESAFLFSIGAFATMGYEKVGEGIREIIKKPKEIQKQ